MKIKAIALSVGLAFATAASFIPLSINDSNASSARGLFDSYNNSLGSNTVNSRSGRTWNGGQISARWNRPHIDIIDFQPPSIDVGCGGIDIFAGGFGLISGDELAQIGRAIAQGATVYFFKLAINSICASCASEMENVAAALRRLNELSRNACERTEQLMTNNISLGEGGTLQQRLERSKRNTAASGKVDGWVDAILDPFNNRGDKEDLAAETNASFPATPLAQANVDASMFIHLGFEGDNPHSLATNVLMTFIGGFSMEATESSDPDEEPTVIQRRVIPSSLKGFFIPPDKDANVVAFNTCVDTECLDIKSNPREYESVLNIVRQKLAGPKNAPNQGIIPRILRQENLEVDQLKFLADFKIPASRWLRMSEEYQISPDLIVDYITIQTTIAIYHQINSAVTHLYSAVQNNMQDSMGPPTFWRESSDAFLTYKENMKSAQEALEAMRKTNSDQLSQYLQIAKLNQARVQGR